jgi:two-component system phosphate regulon sensor histidine kinase PhoR
LKLGFGPKLFIVTAGLITISFACADLYVARALDAQMTERIEQDAVVRLHLLERDVSLSRAPLDDLAAWDAMADDLGARARARVSIIRLDGALIGDSDVDLALLPMQQNHAARPEVREALAHGSGTSLRLSDTVRRRMEYVAIPFSHDSAVAGTVRLATNLDEVGTAIAHVRAALLASTAVAYLVALALSALLARRIGGVIRSLTGAAGKMAAGDLNVRTHVSGSDELTELGRALDHLASSLEAAMTELRSERDLLGGVLDGMEEGVLVLDARGKIVRLNPALRSMLLLDANVVGKPILDVVRNADLKELVDAARKDVASGEVETMGLKPRRLLVRAAPLGDGRHGADSKAHALLAVFRDVTDVRRLETMRRDFVANVSHELRTPVTAVRSAADTLCGGAANDPEAAKRFLDIIARNAERLQRLIEDLLDLSRIESKELALRPESIDLGAFVGHVLSLFRGRADERGVRIASDITAKKRAFADRRALEQVLTNLVDNAVKYCAGATITVRAVDRGERVSLVVEDTGPGIAAAHVPRLFERFYRVDAGRSREVGGTGLGLSIVKHLAEAMRGMVEVESAVGQGSVFTVTLPTEARAVHANVTAN